MKLLKLSLSCGAAAVILLSASQAMAQSQTPNGSRGGANTTDSDGVGEIDRREQFVPATDLESNKPPLHLTPLQRNSIADAIAREHTYQRTPKGFQPRVGVTIVNAINPHPMPRPLIYEIPILRQYTYAKLERNILVVDPMSRKVLYVIPRVWPMVVDPATGAATRDRDLRGPEPTQAPQTTGTMTQSTAQPGARLAVSREKLRQSLEKAGFKDVTIVDAAYLVNARTSEGHQVVLYISPSGTADASGAVSGVNAGQSRPKR